MRGSGKVISKNIQLVFKSQILLLNFIVHIIVSRCDCLTSAGAPPDYVSVLGVRDQKVNIYGRPIAIDIALHARSL